MELYSLPDDVEYIISSLNLCGYRADVVGGPVRDFLLSKAPDDYDITTSATPEEIKHVFSKHRTVDTGIKHGTVTVIIGGKGYEITTYRIDGEYLDSRHPEKVFFTEDIVMDLSRRDFTMNAIAYNHTDGITDPFLGRVDIENGVIRAVGEPDKRFTEDALRILRALRFSSVLGFRIEDATACALMDKRGLLAGISAERVYSEWKKLLSGDNALDVITEYLPVIVEFLPELALLQLPQRALFQRADYMTRFLALFHLSVEDAPAGFFKAAVRLRTDAKTRELGTAVLAAVGSFTLSEERGIARALNKLGRDGAEQLVGLEILLGGADPSLAERLAIFLDNKHPYRISDLKIGGSDLLAIGLRGKEIGDALDRLILGVIDGKYENERNTLLAAVHEK